MSLKIIKNENLKIYLYTQNPEISSFVDKNSENNSIKKIKYPSLVAKRKTNKNLIFSLKCPETTLTCSVNSDTVSILKKLKTFKSFNKKSTFVLKNIKLTVLNCHCHWNSETDSEFKWKFNFFAENPKTS